MISNDDACYAHDLVKTICAKVGPGLPGTSQERERAAVIEKELASHLGATNVTVEEFTFAPAAFLRASPIIALLMLSAALLNTSMDRFTGVSSWVAAMVVLLLSIISPLLFIFEFLFGFELTDPLFKKKQSINVVGTLRRPGTKNVRRLLILSGHHDSAPENTWLRFLGYGFYFLAATWFLGSITMLVMSVIQLVGLIAGNAGIIRFGTLGWALLVYPIVPSILFVLFLTRGWKNGGNVPGAADNLSGSALAVAMCRFLARNPTYIPADVEIRFVSFGSEEAGCRGSRRYVACHLDELKRLDVRLLNYETIAHPEPIVLTSETNGTVKNSPEMVQGVIAAAERAGVPYKAQSATLGTGSDAGPFSRAGLKATTLVGFRMQQQVAFYHQKWDTPEVLTLEPLLNVLKLTLEWVRSGGE
jgi:hypothetical protein